MSISIFTSIKSLCSGKQLQKMSGVAKTSMFSWLFGAIMLLAALPGQLNAQTYYILGTGTGSNTTTTYPSPFAPYFEGARHQFLVKADQIAAAGITPNSMISSIGFNVTALNGVVPFSSYSLRVYTTLTADPLATGWVTTGLVATSNPTTPYSVALGWNQLTFSPFVWDGNQNLIIETCSYFGPWASGINNASVQWTASGLGTGTWSRWYRADGVTTPCNTTTLTSTSTTTRPNIRIGATAGGSCSGTPAPGNTLASPASVCPGVNFSLSLQNSTSGSDVVYQWQSSATGTAGSFTNISGANSSSYSATQTASTYYQCIVTCGGNSTTSNPVQVTMNPFLNCYCTAGSPDVTFEKIGRVQFNTIDNSSTSTGGYEDFTSVSTTVYSQTIVPITVTIDGGFNADQILVWIDFNHNGSYADAGELVYSSSTGVGPHTGNITIPASALAGATNMRIRLHDTSLGANSTPCGTSSYGQVEDYRIIIDNTPCPGTNPGNTIASATTVCNGNTVALSLQNATGGAGISYQWQVNTGSGYVNIPGAVGGTYTASVTDTSYFQCIVTCGGNAQTSVPVKVGLNPYLECYCTPPVEDCSFGDNITRVKISTLDNVTACSPDGFGDYKSTIPPTVIYSGTSNPIHVEGVAYDDFLGNADGFAAWLDLNRNGVYDASETIIIGNNVAGFNADSREDAVFDKVINIPAGTPSGLTGLRVRASYNYMPDFFSPCEEISGFGETEEYLVDIQPCVPVSITSHPENSAITCGGATTFTATTSGTYPVYSWQYLAPTSGAVWQTITDGGIYSGATTSTLALTNVPDSYAGYQYRVLVTGGCSAPTPTNAATLTVNALVATVSPVSAAICAGSTQQLSITNMFGVEAINEGFEDWGSLASNGWSIQNLSTAPYGAPLYGWDPATVLYTGVFAPHGGSEYAMSSYYASQTYANINTWLITPQMTSINNGDVITFWARSIGDDDGYPDRLQVRLSTNGASTNAGTSLTNVGDFSIVLADINPTYQTGVIPNTWTKFTVTVSGLTGTVNGRIAFRHFVDDPNSGGDFLGLDDITYTLAPAPAQGTWSGPAGTIFTDATATTPYTGTLASTVFVKPAALGVNNYTVSFNTATPCQSTTATIPVTVNSPVTGTATTNNASVCVGGTVSFTANAQTSGGPVMHQWKVSTNGGTSYTNVSNGGVYSGATTNTLTITEATAAMSGYMYKDSIYSVGCTAFVSTNAATLTVNTIAISASPVTALYPGLTTTLAVAVSNSNTTDTYQWYNNGVPVPGATSNTLVVNVDGLGEYTVAVNNGQACPSTPASITITEAENDILFIYPSPNSGQFQVRYYSQAGNNPLPRILNVYDSKGARVYSKQYSITAPYTSMGVDMSNYSAGIYHVELLDRSGNRLKTGRVLIQK